MGATFDQSQLDRLANEVLTLIEFDEARLLNWGFVQVRSNLASTLPQLLDQLSDVGQALWRVVQGAGVTSRQILANLQERKLLFESGGRYRSRFAETIRLLTLLRQRFSVKDWNTAPRLVSDLRLHLQRRRYPRRDRHIDDLLAALEPLDIAPQERATLIALTSTNDQRLTLAQFQYDAILCIFQHLRDPQDRALVIGAGTGAGKTKAFYLPALAWIAASMTAEPWVKALAIYPRIELLKDQYAEAFSEARTLLSPLKRYHQQPISIGAYYGDTPRSAAQLLESAYQRQPQSWQLTSSKDGWVFPTMRCPDCQEALIWWREDVQAEERANREGQYGKFARLRCGNCGYTVGSDQLRLTRDHMVRQPPDLLFTTTEMLNRRLSRTSEHALFGIGLTRPPRLLLLDEIHTYEGLNGAHVAYLLRRWRAARGRHYRQNLCIVGLSATLTQAEDFFARLTGLPSAQVSYITPRQEDLLEEGIEYNLILKGDPVSGTSLLSTSVQTVMLLGRVLDPLLGAAISRGAYGRKIFAFTDKLDVINRWYHIEQEAETQHVLSQYRQYSQTPSKAENALRNEAGQIWWMSADIGHNLRIPFILDITSSQYRGVRPDAALVVATSTLEVGFNDPEVGAVVQHKAPRSLASFLQRKGRAGRTRTMRPWMVTVTSAYGRDRWAFQHAEQLFSPTLPPLSLPLDNVYVQKIQAVYAMLDWLAGQLAQQGDHSDLWAALRSSDRGNATYLARQRNAIVGLLEDILRGGERREALQEHFRTALGLQHDENTLHMIMWGEPRPLLLDVIPTVLRQVESNWQRLHDGSVQPWSDRLSTTPLPDYVPPNLFSVLSVPELTLHIPEDRAATAMRDDETITLVQGMIEFAPAHVSKRYARSHRLKEAHWLALPADEQIINQTVQLNDLAIDRSPTPRRIALPEGDVLVYHPQAYTLAVIPESVKSTSYARLLWYSVLSPQIRGGAVGQESSVITGTVVEVLPGSPWRRLITDMRSYTQASGSWLEVTRMAVGVRTATHYDGGNEVRRRLWFRDGASQAALGFSLYVDALGITVVPLDTAAILNDEHWQHLRQHLLPLYMQYVLSRDAQLEALELSEFEVGWLWQLELSMLVATAIARQASLQEAALEVHVNRNALARRTMDTMFQSQALDEAEESEQPGRLYQRLIELLDLPSVVEALERSVAVLWQAPDALLEAWLQQCYMASMGATLLHALTRLTPDINAEDLIVDIVDQQIWISEQTPGGVGLISRIVETIAARPRDLDLQLFDVLHHCDRAYLSAHLHTVAAQIAAGNPLLQTAFAELRSATNLTMQRAALSSLTNALQDMGIPATRDLLVALNMRFLRPNADTDSDQLLAILAQVWESEQQRLGCAIDVRVMAVAARRVDTIDVYLQRVLQRISGNPSADESQVFNLLQSLLWLSCQDGCPDCIEYWSPFQVSPNPSRALLAVLVPLTGIPIVYGSSDWQTQITAALSSHASATLVCRAESFERCREDITQMLVTPLEIGFQYHYVTIDRLERSGSYWQIDLVIRDLIQR